MKTRDAEPRVIDVETSGWAEHGGKMGSSIEDMTRWDTTQRLDKCDAAYYVSDNSTEPTVQQCADGTGYVRVCNTSSNKAWARAVNVIRSCERLPSCRARDVQTGQEWMCRSQTEIDEHGADTDSPVTWIKRCATQYKIICLEN